MLGDKEIEATRTEVSLVWKKQDAPTYEIIKMTPVTWWHIPCGALDYRIGLTSAPNFFHRWMQWLLFGFKYVRADHPTDSGGG